MKKLLLAFAMSIALTTMGMNAQAAEPLLFGGKVGFFKPSGDGNDAGVNIGGLLGQKISENVYWEAELNFGISDGELGGNTNWSINSIAGYGVYRGDGNVHLKAKLGVVYWDDDFDKNTDLSAGVGLGIRAGSGLIDVEYTRINAYTDYITVGYIFHF